MTDSSEGQGTTLTTTPGAEEYENRILPKPELEEDRRGRLIFRWPTVDVTGTVTHLSQAKSGEVSCFIRFHSALFGTILPRRHLNLSADRTVTSLVNGLNRRTSDAYNWERIMDHVSEMCDLKLTQGKPAVWLGYDPEAQSPVPLVGPFVYDGEATLLSADGGTGKTTFLTACALTLSTGEPIIPGLEVPAALPGLYCDWEGGRSIHSHLVSRLLRGVGIERTDALLYLECRGRLYEQIDHIAKIVDEYGVRLLFPDSVSWACGGDAETMETVSLYERALSEIGIASFNAAHTRKNADDNKPFGSVFWHNMARSSWQVKQVREEEGSIHLAFFHRKANYHKRHKPLGYRVDFSEDAIRFVREDVADHFEENLNLTDRIAALLTTEGPMTGPEAAEALKESRQNVANRLKAGLDTRYVRLGDSRPFKWAVKARDESVVTHDNGLSQHDTTGLSRGSPPIRGGVSRHGSNPVTSEEEILREPAGQGW